MNKVAGFPPAFKQHQYLRMRRLLLIWLGTVVVSLNTDSRALEVNADFSATLNANANIKIVDPTLILNGLDVSKLPLDKLPLDKLQLDKIPLNLLPLKDIDWARVNLPDIGSINVETLNVSPTINIPPTATFSLAISAAQFAFQQAAAVREAERWDSLFAALAQIQEKLREIDTKLNRFGERLDSVDRHVWEAIYNQRELPGEIWNAALVGQVETMQARSDRYLHDKALLRKDVDELQKDLNIALTSATPRNVYAISLGVAAYVACARRAGIDKPEQIHELEQVRLTLNRLLLNGISDTDADPEPRPTDSIAVQIRKLERRVRDTLKAKSTPQDFYAQQNAALVNAWHEVLVPFFHYSGYPYPQNTDILFRFGWTSSYNWQPIPEAGVAASQTGLSIQNRFCLAATYDADRQFFITQAYAFDSLRRQRFVSWATFAAYGVLKLNNASGEFTQDGIFLYPEALTGDRITAFDDETIASFCHFAPTAHFHISWQPGTITVAADRAPKIPLTEFAKSMRIQNDYNDLQNEATARIQARLDLANSDLRRIKSLSLVASVAAGEAAQVKRIEEELRKPEHFWCKVVSSLPEC